MNIIEDLTRLAEAAIEKPGQHPREHSYAVYRFDDAANPRIVLALLAVVSAASELLKSLEDDAVGLEPWYKSLAALRAACSALDGQNG